MCKKYATVKVHKVKSALTLFHSFLILLNWKSYGKLERGIQHYYLIKNRVRIKKVRDKESWL